MKKLADRILDTRTKRGWSAQNLADAAGVSLRTIQTWENDPGALPQPAKLSRVAQALGVETAYLRGEAGAARAETGGLAGECVGHLQRFVESARGDESKLHWTLVELREHFPLNKWEASPPEPLAGAVYRKHGAGISLDASTETARSAAASALKAAGIAPKAPARKRPSSGPEKK